MGPASSTWLSALSHEKLACLPPLVIHKYDNNLRLRTTRFRDEKTSNEPDRYVAFCFQHDARIRHSGDGDGTTHRRGYRQRGMDGGRFVLDRPWYGHCGTDQRGARGIRLA